MSKTHDSEIWKDVKGYEGLYQVSNMGRIRSLARIQYRGPNRKSYTIKEKILKPIRQNHGYLFAEMGKGNVRSIHRLVLEAFVGRCPEGMQCLHNDGNRANNALTNLKWGTPRENAKDRYRHGTAYNGPRGDNHPFAKVNASKVRRIRKQYAAGNYTMSRLGRIHKIHIMTVSDIIRRATWKHVK